MNEKCLTRHYSKRLPCSVIYSRFYKGCHQLSLAVPAFSANDKSINNTLKKLTERSHENEVRRAHHFYSPMKNGSSSFNFGQLLFKDIYLSISPQTGKTQRSVIVWAVGNRSYVNLWSMALPSSIAPFSFCRFLFLPRPLLFSVGKCPSAFT